MYLLLGDWKISWSGNVKAIIHHHLVLFNKTPFLLSEEYEWDNMYIRGPTISGWQSQQCFREISWARSIFQQPRNFSTFCRSDPTVKCQKWPDNWLLVFLSDPRRVFGETPLTPYRAIAHLGSPAGGGRKGLRAVRRKFGSHHTGFRDTGHMGTILSWGIWLQLKLYEAEYHHSF